MDINLFLLNGVVHTEGRILPNKERQFDIKGEVLIPNLFHLL